LPAAAPFAEDALLVGKELAVVHVRLPGVFLWAVAFALAVGLQAAAAERTNFSAEAQKYLEQGQRLQDQGRLKEAIAAYEEAIRRGMTDYPRVYLYRANSTLALKELDKAIARYTDFLTTFPLEESCRH
jgi:tetratricopeptide (TPR) repeat protein